MASIDNDNDWSSPMIPHPVHATCLALARFALVAALAIAAASLWAHGVA
jgi:hypothetical protein